MTAAGQPQPAFVLRGHDAVIHSLAFTHNNRTLLACDDTGCVQAWSLETRRPVLSFMPTSGMPILAVHALSEDLWLTQSKGGVFTVWQADRIKDSSIGDNTDNSAAVTSVQTDMHSFCRCALLESDTAQKSVALPTDDGVGVGVWDTRQKEIQSRFRPKGIEGASTSGPRGPTGMCMALSSAGTGHLLGGYEDGSLQLWDVRSSVPLFSCKPHSEPVFGVSAAAVTTKGSETSKKICVSGGADGIVVVGALKHASDPPDGSEEVRVKWEQTSFDMRADGKKGISSVNAREDGKIVAVGCWDGRVRLYSLKKPKMLASLSCHSKSVQCVQFSPACKWLATGGDDTRIALWDVYRPD